MVDWLVCTTLFWFSLSWKYSNIYVREFSGAYDGLVEELSTCGHRGFSLWWWTKNVIYQYILQSFFYVLLYQKVLRFKIDIAFSSPLTLLILNKSPSPPPTLNKFFICVNYNKISIETGYFHCQIVIYMRSIYILFYPSPWAKSLSGELVYRIRGQNNAVKGEKVIGPSRAWSWLDAQLDTGPKVTLQPRARSNKFKWDYIIL